MPRQKKAPSVELKDKVEENEEKDNQEGKSFIEVVEKADLLERLKDFDNKVLIERLQNIDKKITVLHKEQIVLLGVIREIHNNIVNLSLIQEELVNMLGLETVQESPDLESSVTKESEEKAEKSVKAGKKWN